jgi:hypothetical protein
VIRALALAVLLWGFPNRQPSLSADRLAAVERCRQGYANIDPASRSVAADLARACADIYREPACAEGMRHPPKEPERFAGAIASACREAYCPHLPAPRPALCTSAALPPPTEMLAQWGVLQQHILAYELGADPKLLAPLFQPVTVAMKRDPPSAPDAAHVTVRVYAKPEGVGRARVWIDGGKSLVVLTDEPDGALAALARAARDGAPSDANLVLSIDKNLPHGVVMALIDAFKREGFHKFALSVKPDQTK